MSQFQNYSSLQDIQDFLAQVYPFNRLPDELLRNIAERMVVVPLASGEFINPKHLQEKYLYIVRRGAIDQFEINGQLRARLDQGDVFGFTMLVEPATDPFRAQALEDTLLYLLPINKFRELTADPRFSVYFAIPYQTRLKSALPYSLESNNPMLVQSVRQCCPNEFVSVHSNCAIQDVAQQMTAQRSTSAVVMENDQLVGFISDRNLTKRVIATGVDIQQPISTVMTKNPATIEANDMALQAVSKMMQFGIRHLPVMRAQRVVGVINACDLVRKHSVRAVFLLEAIQYQDSVGKLVDLMPQRAAVFEALVEAEIRPHLIAQIMTMIADAITMRLIELAEMVLQQNGLGTPPCAYAWMAAGSQARYEMQMISDQDNAIVLADDATQSDRDYFQKLADFVCQGLAACDYKLCPGDIMATNPKWCQPVKVWEEYYQEWISKPEREALLNASVFLDIRCVQGDASLVRRLQQYMAELVQGNYRFISILLANSLRVSLPLGFFRSFVLVKDGEHKDTLNIKKRAMNPVIDLARIYGLLAACEAASTYQRLQSAVEQGVLNQASYDDLLGAYQFIGTVRFRHQLQAIRENKPINNHLPPKSLSSFERNHLKNAFRVIADAQEVAKLNYSAQTMLR